MPSKIVRAQIALLFVATLAYADTPAEREAADHHSKGVKYLTETPRDYAAAAREFAVAYKLDANPKYLFNLALAQRLGGDCRAAIESYRAYLATVPPDLNAKNANIGIAKCEEILAAIPKPPEEPVEKPIEPVGEPKPVEPPKPIETPPIEPIEPRKAHRDRLGIGLLIGGGVAAGASFTFWMLARSAASSTHDVGSLEDYEANRDRAEGFQALSLISGGVSIALFAGSVIRFATVKPAGDGVTVAVGGKF